MSYALALRSNESMLKKNCKFYEIVVGEIPDFDTLKAVGRGFFAKNPDGVVLNKFGFADDELKNKILDTM